MSDKIRVEVAYALPHRQKLIALDVEAGTTMYEAVLRSGILEAFPQINPEQDKMGIFGKAVKDPKEHVLRDGERVEIYRPLVVDPKQARLNRDRKSTRLNSSHVKISYAVFC